MAADNDAAWPWEDSPVCLITGSAGGMGRAVGEALARRGATVLLSARDPARAAAAAALSAGEGAGALRSLPAGLVVAGRIEVSHLVASSPCAHYMLIE